MFALPFNFPFRKKDGSLVTIDDAISGGGGGGYVLPPATASTLGGIKVGNNLTIDSAGKLDAPAPTPAYELPTASANTLGGVKIGSGITIDENGAISASGGGGGSTIVIGDEVTKYTDGSNNFLTETLTRPTNGKLIGVITTNRSTAQNIAMGYDDGTTAKILIFNITGSSNTSYKPIWLITS